MQDFSSNNQNNNRQMNSQVSISSFFEGGGGIRRLTVLLRIQTFLENYKRHLNFQIWLQQDFNPNQPRQTRLHWLLNDLTFELKSRSIEYAQAAGAVFSESSSGKNSTFSKSAKFLNENNST